MSRGRVGNMNNAFRDFRRAARQYNHDTYPSEEAASARAPHQPDKVNSARQHRENAAYVEMADGPLSARQPLLEMPNQAGEACEADGEAASEAASHDSDSDTAAADLSMLETKPAAVSPGRDPRSARTSGLA